VAGRDAPADSLRVICYKLWNELEVKMCNLCIGYLKANIEKRLLAFPI
jgi:hypothetical protein